MTREELNKFVLELADNQLENDRKLLNLCTVMTERMDVMARHIVALDSAIDSLMAIIETLKEKEENDGTLLILHRSNPRTTEH